MNIPALSILSIMSFGISFVYYFSGVQAAAIFYLYAAIALAVIKISLNK